MECNYDAPQYVDFENIDLSELDLDNADIWFDQRTEDDEFLRRSRSLSALKIPQKQASESETTEKFLKPARVPLAQKETLAQISAAQKHSSSSKANCPSPKKRQKHEEPREDDENNPPRRSPRLLEKSLPKKAVGVQRSSSLKIMKNRRVSPARSYKCKEFKTSEELELERIATARKEFEYKRKLYKEAFESSKSTSNIVMKKKPAQSVTKIHEMHFATDSRLKAARVPVPKEKDFTKSLREALPNTSALPRKPGFTGLTKPQPFKVATKPMKALPGECFKSMAETAADFHKKTPARYRTLARNASIERRVRSQSPKNTKPQSPRFASRERQRTVHAVSREQQEAEEYEIHKKQQFKANPINKVILKKPVGVPTLRKRPLTVQEEFHLHRGKASSREDVNDDEVGKYEFHANPVNPKILAGIVGVKPKKTLAITEPESPAFCLRSRAAVRVSPEPLVREQPTRIKSVPAPFNGVPYRPKLTHSYTVPEPFAVEVRSKEMLKHRDQKIKQVLENEKKMHGFHAQELPSSSPDRLPTPHKKPLTEVEPFKLKIDERGDKYRQQFKSKVEEEEAKTNQVRQFKAQPNTVANKQPYQVAKSGRLIMPGEVHLHTDYRANVRETFNEHLKAREAQIEENARRQEERREMEEKAQVAKLRSQAVHKAQDIKQYAPLVVKKSEKPLTEAQSPHFSLRTRSKVNLHDS